MAKKRTKKETIDNPVDNNDTSNDKPKDNSDNNDTEVKESTTSGKTVRKKLKPSGEFKCGQCNDVFSSESDANKHVFKEHYGLARINDNSKTPFTEREVLTALIKAQKSFKVLKCKNKGCDKTFKSGLGLKMHWDLCGKDENEITTVCDVCGKRLKNTSFAGHQKTHEIKVKSVSSKPKSSNKVETNNSGKRLSAIRAKNTIRKTTKGEVIISGSVSEEEFKTDSDETEEEIIEEQPEKDVTSQILDISISSQNTEQNFKSLLKLWSDFIQSANDFLRDIPKEYIESWGKEVTAKGKIKCPLEDCSQWFTTRDGLKYHYKRCGIDLKFLWKCRVCQFEAIKGNRIIIQHLWATHKDLLPKISLELACCVETANVTTSSNKSREKSMASGNSYQDFHKTFFKQKSFPNLKPNLNSWIEVKEDEYNIYLPNLNPSVPFRSTLSEEIWIRLNIFQSMATKQNLNFFCGGPIWATAWCPTPIDSDDCIQYLAVASNMNHDIIHTLDDTGIESGLIQIWSVGQLKREFDPSLKPQMVFSIAHFCGMIWDMEWCPGGTAWDDFSNEFNSESLPRLGLLAIACGDGFIRIHSIPHPQSLPNSCNYTLYYNEPVIILNPPGVGNSVNCENTICKCLSWIPSNGQNLIVGGYGSGVIAVWDLTTKSSLLIVEQNPNQRILRPLNSWIGHSAAVNRIKWIPNSSDQFVVSASFDRSAKLWNLRDLPVPITVYKRGLFTALDTSIQWNGMFLAGDDCYQGFMNNAVFKDFGFYNFGPISLTCHKSCVWDLSVSQWTSATVTVDASGEAVIFPYFQFKAEQKRKNYDRIPLYHISTVPLNPNSTETTVSKPVQNLKNVKKDKKSSDVKSSDQSEPPLRTYKEFSTKYGLLFNDYDVSELKAIPQNEINRIRLPTNMQYQRLNDYPLVSINRVSWNPNKTSCAWILTATQSGLCRLSCVPFLNSS